MAETVSDSGPLGHDDEINYLEIDFDDAADIVLPNGDRSDHAAPTVETNGEDLDFQISEYEVLGDAGGNKVSGETRPGDVAQAELAVPHQSNTAESEIGYEDEEPSKGETGGHESEAVGQGHDESAGPPTDDFDEIDYEDDGDLEDAQENNVGAGTQAAMEPSVQGGDVATQVSFHQVLDDTAARKESTEHQKEAHNGSIHEPSEAYQQELDHNDTLQQTADEGGDSATGTPAGEVSDVMVHYNGAEYELCASVHNEDPETYFFADNDNLDAPLWEFFSRLRDVIKDEIESSDDLVIEVPQLKLEFSEVCHVVGFFPPDSAPDLLQGTSNEFLYKYTFRDILNLYHRFKYNDGLEDSECPRLVVRLLTKPNCQERFATLMEAADAGRGWSELFEDSDGSDVALDRHSPSEEGFDEQQADTGFDDEQPGDARDDDMQHEAVEIVEEAYFYDDTNDADDHDAAHVFDDQEAEDLGHHAVDMADHNEAHELAEDDELDLVPDHSDDNIKGVGDDAAYPTFRTNEDENALMPDGETGNGALSELTGAIPADTGRPAQGSELEGLHDETGSAVGASNALSSGNYSLPFDLHSDPPSHQDWLDDFLGRDAKQTTPEMWKTYDALPRHPALPQAGGADAVDEDFIDYSEDEDAFEQPAAEHKGCFTLSPHLPHHSGKSIPDVHTLSHRKAGSEDDADDEADGSADVDWIDYEKDDLCNPSAETQGNIIPSIEKNHSHVATTDEDGAPVASLATYKPMVSGSSPSHSWTRSSQSLKGSSSLTRRPVCKYRTISTSRYHEAVPQARSSISPGQAALMMQPQTAAQSAYAFPLKHSPRAHPSIASSYGSRLSQHSGANLSDLQVQEKPNLTSETTGVEDTLDALPHDVLEHGNDSFAANDDSIDMEGFTAYDEAANDEPLVIDPHVQVPDAHDTSATSTLNGDEITYEDEDVAVAENKNDAHEAGDDAAENGGDEIDWENDGAEDVALAEDPANQSSPSGLSVKRGREEDDLIGLEGETGMSTRLENERRCRMLMPETDAKRRKT